MAISRVQGPGCGQHLPPGAMSLTEERGKVQETECGRQNSEDTEERGKERSCADIRMPKRTMATR